MMTERAKGLGRFQKGEQVRQQSWWFVLLAAKIHPPTQKCLLTQASQSGSVTWGLHWLYPHPGTWPKKMDISVSTFNFCLDKIPYCWAGWWGTGCWTAGLLCWLAGYLREEKKKTHQVTDHDFISKCNFLFCSVTIFWEEKKHSTGDNT